MSLTMQSFEGLEQCKSIEFADPFADSTAGVHIDEFEEIVADIDFDPYRQIEGALHDIAVERAELGHAKGDMEQAAFNAAIADINNKVQNIYNVASDYYDPRLAEGMAVFGKIQEMVEAMGCNHNHFMEQALAHNDASEGHAHDSLEHLLSLDNSNYTHDDDDDESLPDSKKSKNRKKLSMYELLAEILNKK